MVENQVSTTLLIDIQWFSACGVKQPFHRVGISVTVVKATVMK